MTYIPSLKESVSIVINAKADPKNIHVLCTDLQQEDISTIFRSAKKGVTIENSYKDAKQLGLESIVSERAKRPIFSCKYSDTAQAVPSMEFVITWVRKKTRQGFIHYIWDKLKQGTFDNNESWYTQFLHKNANTRIGQNKGTLPLEALYSD